eukprot:1160432-Pelagomonas_calceolata.AAC.5
MEALRGLPNKTQILQYPSFLPLLHWLSVSTHPLPPSLHLWCPQTSPLGHSPLPVPAPCPCPSYP